MKDDSELSRDNKKGLWAEGYSRQNNIMNREVEVSEQHACISRVVLASIQKRQPPQTAMLPWGSTAGRGELVAQAGEVGRSWDNGGLGLHAKESGLSFEDARESSRHFCQRSLESCHNHPAHLTTGS